MGKEDLYRVPISVPMESLVKNPGFFKQQPIKPLKDDDIGNIAELGSRTLGALSLQPFLCRTILEGLRSGLRATVRGLLTA